MVLYQSTVARTSGTWIIGTTFASMVTSSPGSSRRPIASEQPDGIPLYVCAGQVSVGPPLANGSPSNRLLYLRALVMVVCWRQGSRSSQTKGATSETGLGWASLGRGCLRSRSAGSPDQAERLRRDGWCLGV